MMYNLVFSTSAIEDLAKLKKNEPQVFKKANKLLQELTEHPMTGSGKPEMLKGNRSGQWSRRLSQRHRLVYEIQNDQVQILILSAYGHYED